MTQGQRRLCFHVPYPLLLQAGLHFIGAKMLSHWLHEL